MNKATLRLFNAIQVEERGITGVSKATLERTIKNGYILDPAITPNSELLDTIESVIGISGEKANSAFHKSWVVVQDTPMAVLVIQQIIHYLTTYGFEALGIYDEDTVYIPHEVLELPAISEDIPLVVVRAMSKEDILDKIVDLGSIGIALKQETLDDIMLIVGANAYSKEFVGKIRNRELKALLYAHYAIVPSEPVEFLRWLIGKLAGESLLIKNDYLIAKIKEADAKVLDSLLCDAPDNLASIFFRFKPLFLAMKSISGNKTFFNQLRKKADKLHKPMPEDYLNSVTAKLKSGTLDYAMLARELDKVNIFRKIRLAYALKFRTVGSDAILYRVRNGSGWAAEFDWQGNPADTKLALQTILVSIAIDVQKNVKGQTFYIPDHIHYTLPATEKQFVGHFPSGSYVTVPQDMVAGIHWTNTSERVDLDLSVISETGKVGWDAAYRTSGRSVLFSGDMVDAPAPRGASEVFYLKRGNAEAKIMLVNYYNFCDGDEVEAKILVAHEDPRGFRQNYMVNTSNILASAIVNISKRQNIIGLIVGDKFYFTTVSIGNSITSHDNEWATLSRKYLVNSLVNSLELRSVLVAAGATVVNERPESEYIDLSPEALDKLTIMNLLIGQ